MYDDWCNATIEENGRKKLYRITEKTNGRDAVFQDLVGTVRNHYIGSEEIALFMAQLGHADTAELIRELYPVTAQGKSGDIGEILAAELIEEWLGYRTPIKKLRLKDHRNMAMRGEDIIGIHHDEQGRLWLLKGESKSAQSLSTDTVTEARSGLNSQQGRPSPHSLIFIARQLLNAQDPEDQALGNELAKETIDRAVPKERIAHFFFTLTGNAAIEMIDSDFSNADGGRPQYISHFRIVDHQDFIESVFVGVADADI